MGGSTQIDRGRTAFSSSVLLTGNVSAASVRLQLSRWVKSGRLLRLRRGLYSISPVWRKVEPHPFAVANALSPGSYVSLQSALSFHGMIPEHVPRVTSVGGGRPEVVENALGIFHFHHLSSDLIYGYSRLDLAPSQAAFVASPEKALLDLIHLTPGADSEAYLGELRLQNSDAVNSDILLAMAEQSGKPKLIRAASIALALFSTEQEYKSL
jgi:hypothetical protein